MKKSLPVFATLCAFLPFVLLVLLLVGVFANAVLAAGIPVIQPPSTNLWSSINEQGFSFYYGTSSAGGKTNFDAGMTNSDRIGNINMSISRDTLDPTHGWIYASFYGIVDDPAVEMDIISQSTNINRHGVQYSSYGGLSSYQEILSWPKDGDPIYGDWLSTGNASMTLFGVTPTWANMDYSEYTDDWSGNTYFNGSVRWQLNFGSASIAETYAGFSPTSVMAGSPVPEPSTFVLLAIAAISGIVIWRKKR